MLTAITIFYHTGCHLWCCVVNCNTHRKPTTTIGFRLTGKVVHFGTQREMQDGLLTFLLSIINAYQLMFLKTKRTKKTDLLWLALNAWRISRVNMAQRSIMIRCSNLSLARTIWCKQATDEQLYCARNFFYHPRWIGDNKIPVGKCKSNDDTSGVGNNVWGYYAHWLSAHYNDEAEVPPIVQRAMEILQSSKEKAFTDKQPLSRKKKRGDSLTAPIPGEEKLGAEEVLWVSGGRLLCCDPRFSACWPILKWKIFVIILVLALSLVWISFSKYLLPIMSYDL